ncbi:MAG: TraB/GumN family protein [Nanoarchaeota archaeon]
MENKNLCLVGTVHNDLDGKERLDTLLDRLSPSIVALEYHEDRECSKALQKSSQEEHEEFSALIQKSGLSLNQGQMETLTVCWRKAMDVMGYELRSSRDYVSRNGNRRLEYIDLSLYKDGQEKFTQGYAEALKLAFNQITREPELVSSILERLDRGIDIYLNYLRGEVQQRYQNVELIDIQMEELSIMMEQPHNLEMMQEAVSSQAIRALQQFCNPAREEAMSNRIRELYTRKNKLVAVVGLGHLHRLKRKVEDLEPRVMTLAEYNST